MPQTPVKVVIDLSKSVEEREQIIPLSQTEIDELTALGEQLQAEKAVQQHIEEARQAAKISAEAKLAKLGLTSAEIEALLGA